MSEGQSGGAVHPWFCHQVHVATSAAGVMKGKTTPDKGKQHGVGAGGKKQPTQNSLRLKPRPADDRVPVNGKPTEQRRF